MLTEALLPNNDEHRESVISSTGDEHLDVLETNPQWPDDDRGPAPEPNEDTQRLITQHNDNKDGAASSRTDMAKVVVDIIRRVFLPEQSLDDPADNRANTQVANQPADVAGDDDAPSSSWLDVCLLDPLAAFVSQLLNLLNTNTDFFPNVNTNIDFVKSTILLILSTIALQVSYLTWGYLQELVMTHQFNPTDRVTGGRFPSAIFCVWANRLVALAVSSICVHFGDRSTCCASRQTQFVKRPPPLRAFAACAISISLSSYCQYAALRFVSFPTMTLFRLSKIVIVMIMGKLVHGTRYAWSEYVEGILITLGVVIFSRSHSKPVYDDDGSGTFFFGYVLLLTYVFCDAFTTQWQDKIYQTYGKRNVDTFQMIFGVNMFALAMTTFQLWNNELGVVIDFLVHNPVALTYVVLNAVSSTAVQLSIYFVIREFGSVVYIIIMTTRQLIAICLSAIIFGHNMSASAFVGAMLVFGTVCYQIRRNYTLARQPEVLLS